MAADCYARDQDHNRQRSFPLANPFPVGGVLAPFDYNCACHIRYYGIPI